MKSEETKERIIKSTISLIENGEGKVEQITIRKIAETTGVGVGLINHYFKTKENLIEICVQRMIEKVVYQPARNFDDGLESDSKLEMMKKAAKYVMNFLFHHPEVSYISILGDMSKPSSKDNTCGTVYGFANRMADGEVENADIQKAFEIVSLMQMMFVKKELVRELFHLDLEVETEREQYMDHLVEMIMK